MLVDGGRSFRARREISSDRSDVEACADLTVDGRCMLTLILKTDSLGIRKLTKSLSSRKIKRNRNALK
jgi:hypothetical protein